MTVHTGTGTPLFNSDRAETSQRPSTSLRHFARAHTHTHDVSLAGPQVSATVGDFIILLLFLMVRIRIEERDEWTDEDKTERRKWWRNRTLRDTVCEGTGPKLTPGLEIVCLAPVPMILQFRAPTYTWPLKRSHDRISPSAINTTCRTIAFWFIAVPWLRPSDVVSIPCKLQFASFRPRSCTRAFAFSTSVPLLPTSARQDPEQFVGLLR